MLIVDKQSESSFVAKVAFFLFYSIFYLVRFKTILVFIHFWPSQMPVTVDFYCQFDKFLIFLVVIHRTSYCFLF